MVKKRTKQLVFHDWPSGFHGARIFEENRWVNLATIMPWDLIEKKNSEAFTGQPTGNPSITNRMAFGALVIKRELNLSDVETVTMFRENPHCQYFLGIAEFTDVVSFDSSKMVAFRRRFPADAMADINEAIRKEAKSDEPQAPPDCYVGHDENDPPSVDVFGKIVITPR